MSEPELIRNTAPHEISMPVGGRNAMGKSAHVGEPTIRRVLAEDNAYPTAPPSPAEKGGPTIRRVLAEDGAHLTAPPSPVENRTAADTAPLPAENRTVADTAPLPAENWTAADTAPLPAENWTAADTPPAQRKTATLAVDETTTPVAPAKDQRTDSWRALVAPLPQASEHAIAVAPNIAVAADLKAQISDELAARLASEHAIVVADLKTQISDELALRLASEQAFAVAADLKVQISDGLAARLTALKTENDQVLQQLDGLEKLLAIQP